MAYESKTDETLKLSKGERARLMHQEEMGREYRGFQTPSRPGSRRSKLASSSEGCWTASLTNTRTTSRRASTSSTSQTKGWTRSDEVRRRGAHARIHDLHLSHAMRRNLGGTVDAITCLDQSYDLVYSPDDAGWYLQHSPSDTTSDVTYPTKDKAIEAYDALRRGERVAFS